MTWYKQATNWWCGPTTAQMTIRYLTGKYYYQSTIARYMGTYYSGSSCAQINRAIRYYSGYSYVVRYGFDRARVVTNIQKRRPVPINFNGRYLAYTGYHSCGHHSPIKGYTSTGYYIHDSTWGSNRWASRAQTYNAVRYHHNTYITRY